MTRSPHQDAIDALVRELSDEEANGNGNDHAGSRAAAFRIDAEILEKCWGASNAAKFSALYDDGDVHAYHDGDDSRADAALLSIMAFYTQDASQLDRLFRGSALYRPKWERDTYRNPTINKALEDLGETYSWPRETGGRSHPKSGGKNLSSLSSPLGGGDSDDRSAEEIEGLVCFANEPAPDPVKFVLEQAVPMGYVTNLHGAGGFGKSVLAMMIAISISGYQKNCLGLEVLKHGKVLYLDSELDQRGQHPRVKDICRGLDIPVPEGLHYLSALGLDTATAFERACRAAQQLEPALLVVDSWGPLMEGDMESARDVIRFYNNYLRPFVDLGVTVLISEADKAAELTVNSRDRVLAALVNDNLTVKELAADTGLAEGTIRNALSELVPDEVHAVQLDGRTKIYGMPNNMENLSSLSPSSKGDDNDDRSEDAPKEWKDHPLSCGCSECSAPLSADLRPGESAMLEELRARREASQREHEERFQ